MNYLTLVNKEHKIKDSYLEKVMFTQALNVVLEKTQIEQKTYDKYLELKEFLKSKNIIIGIDTAYRDEAYQQKIWDFFEKEKGKEYCNNYVAPVGYSEHHTGLAIDISLKINGSFLIDNGDLLKYDEDFKQIHPYLKDFGFILRYPKGKEKITGYNYEPWHIRYVGKIPAKIIYENNLCLEEYLNGFGGVIVVNKEKGMTSFDVVNEVSHILGIKRIGHTGTLDPLATGVLVLTIGRFTKLGEDLSSLDKEYVATLKIGILTDTLDIEGNKISENNNKPLNLEETLKLFKKTYMQEVPKYSAVKVNGKKLYQYAREGIDIELPKKKVTIKEIELLDLDNDLFSFRTVVSKGTYIRSLIRDIGNSCNTLMTMTDLKRTRQGKFRIEDSYTLDDIRNSRFKILSLLDVLDYKVIEVDYNLYKKISNGVVIENSFDIEDKVIFKYNDKLIAIYKKDNNLLRMYKKID
ncbi:MAG: tRNA pseudouridine(55) synthase TruB [Bacilli bacterium]|nr:tRNA pseudouridine(55) synthase TruB [Bacilli bacterium]